MSGTINTGMNAGTTLSPVRTSEQLAKLETEIEQKLTTFLSRVLEDKELNDLIMRSLNKMAFSKRPAAKKKALTIIENYLSPFLKDQSLFAILVKHKNLSDKIIEFVYNKLPTAFARVNRNFSLEGRSAIVKESAAFGGRCADYIALRDEEVIAVFKNMTMGEKPAAASAKRKQAAQGLKQLENTSYGKPPAVDAKKPAGGKTVKAVPAGSARVHDESAKAKGEERLRGAQKRRPEMKKITRKRWGLEWFKTRSGK